MYPKLLVFASEILFNRISEKALARTSGGTFFRFEGGGAGIDRVADPVLYWPDPDPTSQDKPDPDPDPDTSVLKIFHLFYDEF